MGKHTSRRSSIGDPCPAAERTPKCCPGPLLPAFGQLYYNNHTGIIQQPYNNHTTTHSAFKPLQNPQNPIQNQQNPQDPKGGAPVPPLATLRYVAATGEGGRWPSRRAALYRPHPRRTPRAAPAPPLAILRHGAARPAGGLPEGPPSPTQDPKGGAGATLAHALATLRAPRRGEGDRRLTRRAAPSPESDPAPPEIGRGPKRALTHRSGKSNRLM